LLQFDRSLLRKRAVWERIDHSTQLFLGAWNVLQILAADLGLKQQGIVDLRAPRILLAEKLILADRRTKSLLVAQHSALFGQQIGDRGNRRPGFGRRRTLVVDQAKGVQHFFVAISRPLLLRTRFQLIAQMNSVVPRGLPGDGGTMGSAVSTLDGAERQRRCHQAASQSNRPKRDVHLWGDLQRRDRAGLRYPGEKPPLV
jgi:hypothetical protein